MKQEECEGCWSYIPLPETCRSAPGAKNDIDRIHNCPCAECLVKVMCHYGCDTFQWYNTRKARNEII